MLAAVRVLASAGALLVACSAPLAPPPPEAKTFAPEGWWAHNGLSTNQHFFADLAARPISTESLAENVELRDTLRESPGAAGLFTYLFQCALRQDQVLEVHASRGGATFEFRGGLGLAPEWLEGPCDSACQEWVSACLFARTNLFGLPVEIWMEGPHPALAPDPSAREAAGFVVREGAFYGNFFLAQPVEYACRGDGFDPLLSTVRACSHPGSNNCGFVQVGACGELDGHTGRPAERKACDLDAQGGYTRCASRASLPGEQRFPEPVRFYERMITLWLRPSPIFGGGVAASGHGRPEGAIACGDPVRTRPARPADPGPAPLGSLCVDEDDCDRDDASCDARGGAGYCTRACHPSTSSVAEAAECGGEGTTCLTRDGEHGACTKACNPRTIEGLPAACPRGSVCTTYSLLTPSEAHFGCAPFCSADEDCPNGGRCHRRTGTCGLPADESLVEDGRPCDPDAPEQVCRGLCFRTEADPTLGLCGSFINLARGRRCHDAPDRTLPLSLRNDPLGLCLWRSCAEDGVCEPPLRCRRDVLEGLTLCGH